MQYRMPIFLWVLHQFCRGVLFLLLLFERRVFFIFKNPPDWFIALDKKSAAVKSLRAVFRRICSDLQFCCGSRFGLKPPFYYILFGARKVRLV